MLDQITKSKNLLAAALDANDCEVAVAAIRDALGIDDDDVANYWLPLHWPRDRDQRASALSEWLSNELHFLV